MSSERTDFSIVRLLLLFALFLAVSYFSISRLRDLFPPGEISIAAGHPDGAYYQLARRYRNILARDNIVVDIRETNGSVDNALLLTDPENRVDAAFLQGGIPVDEGADVEGLAATFLEPLWVFHRGALSDPADLVQWSGLRIAAGTKGSGTRYVVGAVSQAIGYGFGDNILVPAGGQSAADALQSGDVDVALFVAPVSAPYLTGLFLDPEVTLVPIRDASALARQLPFVRTVNIPRSGFDYAKQRPDKDVELIAMLGRLVARSDLHPALVDRLINAARIVHSGRDLITSENQFPSSQGIITLPTNAQAATLLSTPPSKLYGYLPYWVVAQINSVALLILPLLVILVPLLRLLPGIYRWRMRSRVYRRYPELLDIEKAALTETDPGGLVHLEHRLSEIELEIVRLKLPIHYHEYAYTMRMHIDLVRQRLSDRRENILKPSA